MKLNPQQVRDAVDATDTTGDPSIGTCSLCNLDTKRSMLQLMEIEGEETEWWCALCVENLTGGYPDYPYTYDDPYDGDAAYYDYLNYRCADGCCLMSDDEVLDFEDDDVIANS